MNSNLTDITIILDRSGSMASIQADTIGGFNSLLEDQKKQPGEVNLTLVQFDTGNPFEVIHNAVKLADVPPLTDKVFVPRGGTPLRDAVGRGIVATGERLRNMDEADRPGKVLFVIMTDGEENSSVEYTAKQIKEMIGHQQNVYKWEFMFVGANQDAVMTGMDYGISQVRSVTYAANAIGATNTFGVLSRKMSAYRSAGATKDMDFNEDDRVQAMGN